MLFLTFSEKTSVNSLGIDLTFPSVLVKTKKQDMGLPIIQNEARTKWQPVNV